ncbi:UDP-3-O-(3-hydroxymyristoyl)glucosamine N-acyltransferase [Methylonatrum kenyense]|uniref:UDP-3-O-(3-hydroxymyristoyl)glucosamine N-acyltransferase n=1 Tax=Methylonatrum kenyense TaxID=455253 RepID=UPI0020BF3F50|nr:UDP-3-O-(3-hydroxymyristoyl)glucosamine N-acyltransferase [Methylonatrum kenyense]
MAQTTLEGLANALGLTFRGDGSVIVDHVASLGDADPRSLSFLADPKHRKHLEQTRAGIVVLHPDMADSSPVPVLLSKNPHYAFARAASIVHPPPDGDGQVHPTAWVHPEARLGRNVSIGPHASVDAGCRLADDVIVGPGSILGKGVQVGRGSRLVARVTVWDGCIIGQRCLLHPGAVIGADGFGYANDEGRWSKVPQVGVVRLGNDVDVGCNTTIDRGAIGDTLIGNGVKLDNLVQIGHNVEIGEHTIVVACSGIAGSTRIGRHCAIGGAVGMAGHISIADGVQITGMTQVTKSLNEPGLYSSGTGVEPNRQWRRNAARFHQLDAMAKRLRQLEQQLAARGDEQRDSSES